MRTPNISEEHVILQTKHLGKSIKLMQDKIYSMAGMRKKNVFALHERGWSYAEIADALELSKSMVGKMLSK